MIFTDFQAIKIGFRIINKAKGQVGECFAIEIEQGVAIGCCIKVKNSFHWIRYDHENKDDYKIMDPKISWIGVKIK